MTVAFRPYWTDATSRRVPAAPCRTVSEDGVPAWVVTRWDDARQVLVDAAFRTDTAVAGYPLGPGHRGEATAKSMIRVDGARHRTLRRLFQPEFTVSRVQSQVMPLRRRVQAVVASAVTAASTVDVVEDVAVPAAVHMAAHLLDVPDRALPEFASVTRHLHDVAFPSAQVESAERDLYAWLRQLTRTQVAETSRDQFLLRLRRRQAAVLDISDEDVLRNVRLILAASLQTVSSMIALGTHHFVGQSVRFAAAGPEEAMRAPETEELLRYWSVVQAGPRRVATAATVVGATSIAAGEGVIVSLPAANRDPASSQAVRRDLNKLLLPAGRLGHLAFGYGPHQCLAQNLARAQMALTWHELCSQMSQSRLAEPTTPSYHSGSVIFGLDELRVTTTGRRLMSPR